jgi:hypothetical protein
MSPNTIRNKNSIERTKRGPSTESYGSFKKRLKLVAYTFQVQAKTANSQQGTEGLVSAAIILS